METSEPKWVNPNGSQSGVNSLRLGGFKIYDQHLRVKILLRDKSIMKVHITYPQSDNSKIWRIRHEDFWVTVSV